MFLEKSSPHMFCDCHYFIISLIPEYLASSYGEIFEGLFDLSLQSLVPGHSQMSENIVHILAIDRCGFLSFSDLELPRHENFIKAGCYNQFSSRYQKGNRDLKGVLMILIDFPLICFL